MEIMCFTVTISFSKFKKKSCFFNIKEKHFVVAKLDTVKNLCVAKVKLNF